MANLQNRGRQYPLHIVQDIDFQDLVNGSAASLELALPTNSIVVGGGVLVETAWNSATSAALAVGLNGGGGLVAAANLKTVGFTAFSAQYLTNYNGANAKLTLSEAGAAATQGKAKIFLQYLTVDKTNEVQIV